jgi:hypothetical protein
MYSGYTQAGTDGRNKMDRVEQINVRLSPEEIARLDQKRIDLQSELGKIPSRGEVVRMALDAFLLKRASRRAAS